VTRLQRSNNKFGKLLDPRDAERLAKELAPYLSGGGSSGSGGAVSSVFGRTGAVTAGASDYDASQVDNDSSVSGSTVKDALDALMTGGGSFIVSYPQSGENVVTNIYYEDTAELLYFIDSDVAPEDVIPSMPGSGFHRVLNIFFDDLTEIAEYVFSDTEEP